MEYELRSIDGDFEEALKYLQGVDRALNQIHHDTEGQCEAIERAKSKFDYAYCLLVQALDPLREMIDDAQMEYNRQAALHE